MITNAFLKWCTTVLYMICGGDAAVEWLWLQNPVGFWRKQLSELRAIQQGSGAALSFLSDLKVVKLQELKFNIRLS